MQFVLLHIEYRGDVQTFVIGDVNTVVPFTIGSSLGNEVIIDDPAVPEYVTTYQFGGHHGIIHSGGRGPLDEFAGYRVRVLWTEDLSTVNLESKLPTRVRFKPGYGELHSIADDDPRRLELDRIARAVPAKLADARCEELIDDHLRALNYASRDRAALKRGRIDITSDLDAAIERYVAAWGAEDVAPFSPASWAYVQRFHAWVGLLDRAKTATGEALASRVKVHERGPGVQKLVGLHLALLGDDSPFAPLVALLKIGVTTFALPGGSFVLWAPHADRPELATRVAKEKALAGETAVLADYIEEGGEARRATIVRSGATIANQRERLQTVKWFPNARAVMLAASTTRVDKPAPAELAEITPPAFVVVDGREMPLGRTNIFHVERGRLRCDPINDPSSNIVCRGAGVFWLDEGEFYGMELNGSPVRNPMPLYDGDLIRVRAVHPQGSLDAIATFHLGS
ncbi:MAG: hypothetical protein QM831_42925 [Kofleriaceae bacterium]